jgi:RIO-like serine/threonine protein kinase
MVFKKVVSSELEIELQKVSAGYGWTPNVVYVDGLNVVMESVNGLSLYDKYGDSPSDIPEWIWTEIFRILTVLYECEGIEYVDITSYNFMEAEGKIWIIDFGHAYYTKKKGGEKPDNWFLQGVLDGEKRWNPDFA